MTAGTLTTITDVELIRPIVAKHLEESYSRFTLINADTVEEITQLLANSPADADDAQETADNVRWALWGRVSGGGVSASVTQRIYASLGRSNEISDQW